MALLLAAAAGSLRADDTTRRGRLKPVAGAFDSTREAPAPPDTLTLADGNVTVGGYDKPLRSDRETMFLTNHTGATLAAVELEIVYTTADGRELHRRRVWARCGIPPGATRKIDLRSWDVQHSFYYLRGVTPRRNRVTPYDVAIIPLRATL